MLPLNCFTEDYFFGRYSIDFDTIVNIKTPQSFFTAAFWNNKSFFSLKDLWWIENRSSLPQAMGVTGLRI